MHHNLAERAAAAIHDAFAAYQERFHAVTACAGERFAARDWHGSQEDATARLDLYRAHVDAALAELPALLGDSLEHPATWMALKGAYTTLVAGRPDCEIAETFYNSLTRRVFATVGVEPRIEFTADDAQLPPCDGGAPVFRTLRARRVDAALVRRLLEGFSWRLPWRALDAACERVAAVLREDLALDGEAAHVEVDLVDAPFFRNKGAYLVGRMRCGGAVTPVVIALLAGPEGMEVDAVLTTEDEASVVFGFSWSYFRVEAPRPRALVEFLHSIMPRKRIDELYTAIGYNKHGKTELFRLLVRHMRETDATFEFAEGDEGLVMAVFALPSLNLVFKIIKDTFGQPKTTTRAAVKAKYQLVFLRDRAGRLADAQEFEQLEFAARCFPPALLEYLQGTCAGSVYVEGDQVVIDHCYTERRVTPLNVALRHADARGDGRAARAAILDYGRAIKDLAGANIFTGDMLLKNFGVTRHGRVIFYDYDELALLTECNFRRLPQPTSMQEEMSAEPWFYVGEHDVFPEEFSAFLVPRGALREIFLAHHADLLDPAFWQGMQRRLATGDIPDVFPYGQERRAQVKLD